MLAVVIQLFIFLIHFCNVHSNPTFDSLSPHCQILVEEVITNYFKGIPQNNITISPLLGGHSNTSLRLVVNEKTYALRIKDKETSQPALMRELYAMHEAARIGISPKILYVSNDCKAILMDYIEGGTSNMAQNKQPENCIKIAISFRKAHAISKNPYFEEDSNESAANAYKDICNFPGFKERLDEALELMWKYNAQLKTFDSNKVNIHGELNSRNIFLTDEGAIFIDWEYTCWEDPFSDLSYFALRVDYNEEEELLLLESYLKHFPSRTDIERYYLTKKLNLAQLCIWFHYFSLKFNKDRIVLDDASPIKEWSYYMSIFSDQPDDEKFLAQYYYDLAKCCLNLSKDERI